MAPRVADLHDRIRNLVPELAKFGVVGGIGTVVDIGGAAVLHSYYHQGPLTAKAVSISVATVITYLGSRFWTFKHRENQPLLRETVLFFVLNLVGLIIAEAVIGCSSYVLSLKGPIMYNLASLVGTGLGTIFRFFAYRKWVFLAPAVPPVPAVAPAAPAYAPWEPQREPRWEQQREQQREPRWEQQREPQRGEPTYWEREPRPAAVPAYSARPMPQSREVRSHNSFIPNGPVAPPLATATATVPAWPASEPWSPAPSRPAARPEPAGPRTPGRHRKRR